MVFVVKFCSVRRKIFWNRALDSITVGESIAADVFQIKIEKMFLKI